uniref:hypothetical protein n=1 Tax=Bartonella sp. CL34QHWL TaxID=3243526 RepID=UPI0035D12154
LISHHVSPRGWSWVSILYISYVWSSSRNMEVFGFLMKSLASQFVRTKYYQTVILMTVQLNNFVQ